MAHVIVSSELTAELGRLASPVSKQKGAVLFRRGDEVSGIFLVRKGKVRVELDAADNIYRPRILGPNSILGLPATLSGAPYSLTAMVVEQSDLDFVPRQAVIKLLRDKPSLCFQILTLLSEEIAQSRSAMKAADSLGYVAH
jgi:CRP-like cAMP-binding protein